MSLWLSNKLIAALQNEFSVGPVGPIATLMLPKVEKKLHKHGVEVVSLDESSDSLYAAIVIGRVPLDLWSSQVHSWREAIVPGGQLVAMDKPRRNRQATSTRFLCAGLSDLRQYHAGGYLITCGTLV